MYDTIQQTSVVAIDFKLRVVITSFWVYLRLTVLKKKTIADDRQNK